jgi:DNA-binding transcriptional ArsR family regulator
LTPHPLTELVPALHAPKRLAVMALLAGATSTDFAFLRDELGVSDSDLSKQMSALETEGFVSVRKSGRGRGSVTSYRITSAGTRAYRHHVAALRRMLDQD